MTVLTGDTLNANDERFKLSDVERDECRTWLEDHGYGRDRPVFQIEYDIIDMPVLRCWWMTRAEINTLTNYHVRAANDTLMPYTHVTDVALRYLPSWWQPTAAT